MNKYETFTILLENLSPIYIFTTIVTGFAIIITFISIRYLNNSQNSGKNVKNQNENSESEESYNTKYTDTSKGLLAQLRSAKIKQIEESLTEEQIAEEKSIEREQLAAIYKLLKEQESLYHTGELDETDLKEQLKLYR